VIPRPHLRRTVPTAQAIELLSITERSRYLSGLRLGLSGVVVAITVASQDVSSADVSVVTGIYLACSALTAVVAGRGGRAAAPVLNGSLLMDGLFLALVVAQTGGTAEALLLLPGVHIVGVTLLISYRTGLKIALWHTLLFLLAVEAARAGILQGEVGAALGRGAGLVVAGLWVLALGTAFFSAVSERELRRQKHDLFRLSVMVGKLDSDPDVHITAQVFLDELCSTFGFERGVILASPQGDLEVLAWVGEGSPVDVAVGVDRTVSRAWQERTSQLVRSIDPETDPRIASLVPDARNVMVVPLLRDHRQGLGAVVVERGENHPTERRWVIEMVEQFAEHGALALHNAWLTEERESQLRIIQGLEQQLRAQNGTLEATVAKRTDELQDLVKELQEIGEQRKQLLGHVVRAAEDERTRISHDIHDDPVQKMIALKMRLELLRRNHPEPAEMDEALDVMQVAIRSMRTLLFDLSPPTLEEQGLASALRFMLEQSSWPFEWSVDEGSDDDFPIGSSLILYRIAQEALANARKHSGAERVSVSLDRREGGTWMQIADDGVGFRPQDAPVAAPGHLGLAAMKERAEMAGGWCKLWSLPDEGTTLEVWLPDVETPHPASSVGDGSVADVLLLPGRQERPERGATAPLAT
jgi:signal transduction histidine kinase